jgi:hypothetical protein
MRALPPWVSRSIARTGGSVAKVRVARGSGRQRTSLQADWASALEIRRLSGEIVYWREESVSLRLAQRTWYRPDFLVVMAGGSVELHEVKGHWEDDARVKWKVAAEAFPFFLFRAVRRSGRGASARWVEEVAPTS